MHDIAVNSAPWNYDSQLASCLTILTRALFGFITLAFPFMLPLIFSYFFIPPGYNGISNEDQYLQRATKNGMSEVETTDSPSTAQRHPAEEAMRLEAPYGSLWGPNSGERIPARDSEPGSFLLCSNFDTTFGTWYDNPLQGSFVYCQITFSSSDGGSYFGTCTFLFMSRGSDLYTRDMQRP